MISRGISLVASLCCVGISMYCFAFAFGLAGPVTEPLANRVVAFFFAFVMGRIMIALLLDYAAAVELKKAGRS